MPHSGQVLNDCACPEAALPSVSLRVAAFQVLQSWRQDNPGREFAPGKQHVALLMASAGGKERRGAGGGGQREARGKLDAAPAAGEGEAAAGARAGGGGRREGGEERNAAPMQAVSEGDAAADAGGQQQQQQQGSDLALDPSIDLAPDPSQQPRADQPVGHCKFFVNTGRCHRGELCPFLHCPPEVLKQQRKEWLKERWGCGATRGGGLCRRGGVAQGEMGCVGGSGGSVAGA